MVGISVFQSNFDPKSSPLNTIWKGSALGVSEDVQPICNEETFLQIWGWTSCILINQAEKLELTREKALPPYPISLNKTSELYNHRDQVSVFNFFNKYLLSIYYLTYASPRKKKKTFHELQVIHAKSKGSVLCRESIYYWSKM